MSLFHKGLRSEWVMWYFRTMLENGITAVSIQLGQTTHLYSQHNLQQLECRGAVMETDHTQPHQAKVCGYPAHTLWPANTKVTYGRRLSCVTTMSAILKRKKCMHKIEAYTIGAHGGGSLTRGGGSSGDHAHPPNPLHGRYAFHLLGFSSMDG